MTTTLHTEFSVYEIDQAAKQIRRMESRHAPTRNQGNDGEWRSYEHLAWIGPRLHVTYGLDGDILRTTLLSEARFTDGDDLVDVPGR